MHDGEDVQALGVVRQQLGGDVQVIAGVALGDEVEVALDGVVRATRLQVRLVDTDESHEPIAGLAGDLHVAAVVGVAVVVDPIGGHDTLVDGDRPGQIDLAGDQVAAVEQRPLEVGQRLAGGEPAIAQTRA